MTAPSLVDGLMVADFAICACNGGGGGSADWRTNVEDIPTLRAVTDHIDLYMIGVQNPSPPRIYMFDDSSTAADDGATIIKPTDIAIGSPGRWILTAGGTVIGKVEFPQYGFTFATPSPGAVTGVLIGQTIANSEVTMTVPFDDPTATIQVGFSSAPAAILPSNHIDPNTTGTYGTEENFPITVNETVIVTINPGASTQGAGYVLLEIKRS